MSSSAEYVLDSTAVLALLYSEPGHQYVKEVLGKSAVSAVNLAEIVNKLAQMGPMPEAVRESLVKLELRVEEWSEDMANRTGYRSAIGLASPWRNNSGQPPLPPTAHGGAFRP